MAKSSPDFVNLLTGIVAVSVGGVELAQHLVAGALIFACGTLGAYIALVAKSERMDFVRSLYFVAVRVIISLIFTLLVALIVEHFFGFAKWQHTIMPIAFLIGLVPDYRMVRNKLMEILKRWALKV